MLKRFGNWHQLTTVLWQREKSITFQHIYYYYLLQHKLFHLLQSTPEGATIPIKQTNKPAVKAKPSEETKKGGEKMET